jgi:Fe-Mn family superoxide dismutase
MSTEFDRRRFLGATGLAAAGLAAAVELTSRTADAQTAPTAGGPIMTYQIKPLPFSPSGIPGLSEKILVSHYENNSGAVKRERNRH